jgi:hypothetical protein
MILLNKILYELGKNSVESMDNNKEIMKQNMNIYQQVKTLENPQIVIYFILFSVIYVIVKYASISNEFFLSFFIIIIIIYYFIQKDYTLNNNFISNKTQQLKFLESFFYLDENTPYENFDETTYFNIYPNMLENYLHLDPLIVEFFYMNRDYSQNNLSAYRSTLIRTNLLLRVEKDLKIGMKSPGQVLELAKDCYISAMNHFHSCIYSLISAQLENEKFIKQMKLLEKLLYKHMSNIFTICEDYFERNEITVDSKPYSSIYLFNQYDPKTNYHFDFF